MSVELVVLVDGKRFESLSQFELQHSRLYIADFANVDAANVKITLEFKNKNRVYWCNFKCGDKTISLVGTNTVTFSGFTWHESDGKVNAFMIGTRCCPSCCNRIASGSDLVFCVTVHEALPRAFDCVDGVSELIGFEGKEKSDEIYHRNTSFREGERLTSLYVVFYKRGGGGGGSI